MKVAAGFGVTRISNVLLLQFSISFLSALAGTSHAQTMDELRANAPQLPSKNALFKIESQGLTSLQHYLDTSQIRVDKDDITRLVLVTISTNNVPNATYIGIRCRTQEFKVHGYLLKKENGPETWAMSSAPAWQPLNNWGSNPILYLLAENYLCAPQAKGFAPIRPATQILLNLEQW